jgi:adenosylcobinamide kinase / adenosylcobinamide-phosphate guanylyltransferase
MLILVTGGARSGKSRFAEAYAARLASKETGIYVATAQAYDDEMRHRIELHRERRDSGSLQWETREEPIRLSELVSSLPPGGLVLIDCLTLWLSNVLLADEGEGASERVLALIDELIPALTSYEGTVLAVSNEVGLGIVPEYPLGRLYRDLSGIMNQRVAAAAEQVFLVTAGIPLELKSRQFRLDEV